MASRKAVEQVRHVSLTAADFLADADFGLWDCRLCGAYCCLIFRLYTNGGQLDYDLNKLQGWAQWHGEGWPEAWSILSKKFSKRGSKLVHKRVTKELARAATFLQQKRDAGVKGAASRWHRHSTANGGGTAGANGSRDATPMPREGKVREVKGREEKTPPTPPGPRAECPYEAILKAWNEAVAGTALKPIMRLTAKRGGQLRVRWQELAFRDSYAEVFTKAAKAPFLCGDNDRGWVVTFDWLVKNDTNYVKVLEGNYDKRRRGGQTPDTGSQAAEQLKGLKL